MSGSSADTSTEVPDIGQAIARANGRGLPPPPPPQQPAPAAPQAPSGSGGAFGGIDQAVAAKQAAMGPMLQDFRQQRAVDQGAVQRAQAQVQPVPNTPPPTRHVTDALSAFGSPAVAFALLASAFTHAPLVNSLNAAAGAMNAIHANDEKKFETEYKTWKDQTDLALKRHEQQAGDLKLALETMHANVQAGVAELTAAGTIYGDAVTVALAKGHMHIQLAQLAQSRETAAAQLKMEQVRLDQAFKFEQDRMQMERDRLVQTNLHQQETLARDRDLSMHDPMYAAMDKLQKTASGEGRDVTLQEIEGLKRQMSSTTTSAAMAKFQNAATLAEDRFRKEHDGRSPDMANPDDQAKMAAFTTEEVNRASGMSGRNAGMIRRNLTSAADAISDLRNVMELPVSVSSGIFGGREQGPGLLDATREVLANTVTSEEVQAYNAANVGIERALGGLATGGLQVSDSLMKSFGQLTIKEGDTQLIKLRKLATMRQNVDNALEPLSADPTLSKEQKDLVQTLMSRLEEAVPFTVGDVTKIEFGPTNGQTLRQFSKQAGVGHQSAGAQSQGAPPMEGARRAPDGLWYKPDPNRPGKYLRVNP